MGHLIRTYNWIQTPLGQPHSWPQSLQTTLGILLHSAVPMTLFWGDDLFCFYNDAFRNSLGVVGEYPGLGTQWQEGRHDSWPFTKPLLEQVMTSGEPVFSDDQLGPIRPNEQLENQYWAFSYSPVFGDNNQICGVFVTCSEKMEKTETNYLLQLDTEQALTESEQRFQAAIVAIDGVLWTNNARGQMTGLQPGWASLTGQTYDQYQGYGWTMAVHPDDAQPTVDAWNAAVAENRMFVFEHRVRMANGAWGLFSIRAIPLLNPDGLVREWVGVHTNITEQSQAEQALRASERMFRNVTNSSPTGLWLSDETGGLTYLNNTLVEWTGMPYESLLGAGWANAIIDEDRQRSASIYLAAVAARAHYDVLFRIKKGDGLICWCHAAGDPYYDEHGNYAGYAGFCMDVDELVLARQKVEATEATLRGAIELAELGTWEIDLKTGILHYSERLREWYNIGKDEIITPERAYRPVPEIDRPRVQAAVNHAITPGTDGIYDIEYALDPAEAGRERILHIQGKAFINEQGETFKLAGSAQDVTEQRRVQQELERQVQERTRQLRASIHDLQRSNDNLQQFAYVASHDLQEPLRKIQSFSDMLRSQYGEQLSTGGNDFLNRMQTSASRMSTLIKDLLTYSRISTQQDTSTPVALTGVVNSVLIDLDLVIQETNANIHVDNLPVVQGDRSQLGQLFQNLLNNALKFRLPDQAPKINITCQTVAATDLPSTLKPTRDAPAYYCITVTDNGIGFDEKYADRIFQVFQRLHSKSQYAGTGIGLAICEKVVANHGGAIVATSKPGEGAMFSVYLPT